MARPLVRWWPWLLVLALAAGSAYYFFPHVMHGETKTSAAPSAASRGVPVVAARVRTGDMGVYLTGLGTVTALNTVTVHSRVDGQLINVAFTEGQFVHQGDLLAELDPRPFQVQLTQAEGQLAKDQATVQNAQLDLQRYQDLLKKGIIPQQQVATQVATLNSAEGAVKSDQGQIDSAKLNLTYARITSPITGRIGLRLIDAGNIVHAADTSGLVVITQLDPIAVVFTIPEDQLDQLLPQMKTRALPVDAYDRDLKKKIASGVLKTVDNQIDPTTGTVKLKAEFANATSALFPNQFVNARLLVDTVKNAVIVPSAAVQRSPQSMFVYVIKPDKTVESRDVVVRLTEGDQTALASGVSDGETVVTDGVDKLQQGTRVVAQAAGAAGDAQKAPNP
jgi:multidrug efflux system membrane fusion protein